MIDLDRGAVEALLAGLAPGVVPAQLVHAPNGHGKVLVHRDGYKVASLAGPMKKARTHTFHDLESFAAWLKRTAVGREGEVEILADERTVTAALAPDDPSGDLVTCQLRDHPLIATWCDVFGVPMSHKALHAHLRSVVASVTAPAGDALAAGLLKVQVLAGADTKSELDERGFYRLSGATRNMEIEGLIPSRFTIRTPIIAGVQRIYQSDVEMPPTTTTFEATYDLEILLALEIVDATLAFTLICPGLELARYQARLDAVAYLRSLLGPEFLVGLGELTLKDVPGEPLEI